MTLERGKLIRIHLNEADRYDGTSLYEAIVDRCRELDIAGATVFRALEGFGETAEVHRQQLFGTEGSVVIMIVDRPEKLAAVLPVLKSMLTGGTIAVSEVEVLAIAGGAPAALK